MEKNKIDIKNYSLITFCYDLFLGILGDYPTDMDDEDKILIDKTVVLKIVAAEKSKGVYAHLDIPSKYKDKFFQYFSPTSRYTILDIIISEVPIDIAVEEGTLAGEIEAQNYDYYTRETIETYKLDKNRRHEYFLKDDIFTDGVMGSNHEAREAFYNYVMAKIVSIQPNVHIPKFELCRMNVPLKWIRRDKRILEYVLSDLNKAKKDLGAGKDAFSSFLIDSYKLIETMLRKEKLSKKCKNCSNLMEYVVSKKYCSPSCRKRAESKRYYGKHNERLRNPPANIQKLQ